MRSHSLWSRACVAGFYWCVLLINFSFWCSFWLHAPHCPNTKSISFFSRFFARTSRRFYYIYRYDYIRSKFCTELHLWIDFNENFVATEENSRSQLIRHVNLWPKLFSVVCPASKCFFPFSSSLRVVRVGFDFIFFQLFISCAVSIVERNYYYLRIQTMR